MEVHGWLGAWVQVSSEKKKDNRPKIILLVVTCWGIGPTTGMRPRVCCVYHALLQVVSLYDWSVLPMGFKNKLDMGWVGGRGSSIQFYVGFLAFVLTLQIL